jgi:hypothetical protein
MKWLILSLMMIGTIFQTDNDGWELFESVAFTPKYFDEVDAYFEVPTFDKELLAMQGKEISLTGYAIPFDSDSVFMLSALPFASCFFCGGAGPETVAEVALKVPDNNLILDEYITVKGKLKLNDTDVQHLNFILTEATIHREED